MLLIDYFQGWQCTNFKYNLVHFSGFIIFK